MTLSAIRIALVERHVTQVVEATGLSRREAYSITSATHECVAKRLGLSAELVAELAHDGIRAELGR